MAKTQSEAEGANAPALTIGTRGELLWASPALSLAVEPIDDQVLASLLRFVRSVAVSPGVISVLQLISQLSAVRPDGSRVSWVSPAPICSVLGITQQGASKILKRLCALGVLREDGELLLFRWSTTAGARPRPRRLFVVAIPELPIGSQLQLEVETPTPCMFVPVPSCAPSSTDLDGDGFFTSPQQPTQPTPKLTPKKAKSSPISLEESRSSQSSLEIVDENSNRTEGKSGFAGKPYTFRTFADLQWLFEPHREIDQSLDKDVAGLTKMCKKGGFTLGDVVLLASRNAKCALLKGRPLLGYIYGMIRNNSPWNHFGIQAAKIREADEQINAHRRLAEEDALALFRAAELQGVVLENPIGETAVIEGRFISFVGGSAPVNAKTLRALDSAGFKSRMIGGKSSQVVVPTPVSPVIDAPQRGMPPEVLTLLQSRRAALRSPRTGQI